MLETILFGSFFFGNEPEQFLFLLYTILFIWSATMRSFSNDAIFAPHILDVVAAARDASSSEATVCEGAACSSTAKAEILSSLISEKFCGRSVGEIAATCGISIAASAYFDPQRFRTFPHDLVDTLIDRDTKKEIWKKYRYFMSYTVGYTVNFIGDVESWWAKQNFFKTDSVATDTEL